MALVHVHDVFIFIVQRFARLLELVSRGSATAIGAVEARSSSHLVARHLRLKREFVLVATHTILLVEAVSVLTLAGAALTHALVRLQLSKAVLLGTAPCLCRACQLRLPLFNHFFDTLASLTSVTIVHRELVKLS